jgi:hypothetical protein
MFSSRLLTRAVQSATVRERLNIQAENDLRLSQPQNHGDTDVKTHISTETPLLHFVAL